LINVAELVDASFEQYKDAAQTPIKKWTKVPKVWTKGNCGRYLVLGIGY